MYIPDIPWKTVIRTSARFQPCCQNHSHPTMKQHPLHQHTPNIAKQFIQCIKCPIRRFSDPFDEEKLTPSIKDGHGSSCHVPCTLEPLTSSDTDLLDYRPLLPSDSMTSQTYAESSITNKQLMSVCCAAPSTHHESHPSFSSPTGPLLTHDVICQYQFRLFFDTQFSRHQHLAHTHMCQQPSCAVSTHKDIEYTCWYHDY